MTVVARARRNGHSGDQLRRGNGRAALPAPAVSRARSERPRRGTAAARPEVVSRVSMMRIRVPSILLVAIEPGDEPPELGLGELATSVRVLRVRQPLPACQRIRTMRPVAVMLGPTVLSWALPFLQQAARECDAPVLQLGPMVARQWLRDWLLRVLERSQRKALSGS